MDELDVQYLIPQVPLGVPNRENQEARRMRQIELLLRYLEYGEIARASRECGFTQWSHHHWLKDPVYRKAYELVRRCIADRMEDTVVQRFFAESNPKREIPMMKAWKPEVYNPKELAALSDGVNPKRIITVDFEVVLPKDGESAEGNSVELPVQAVQAPPEEIPPELDRPAD